MLLVNELFSGIGSQNQALKNIGADYKIVGYSEIDKYAIESYKLLHGVDRNYGDICEVLRLDYADVWTYSFPCQSISINGSKEGFKRDSGSKSSVLWEIERLLLQAKSEGLLPTYLLMENVKNLVGVKFKSDFESWLSILSDIGYNTYYKVLNSSNYGVPQSRERVIAISILKGKDKLGTFDFGGFINEYCMKDLLEENISFSEELPLDFTRAAKRNGIIYYDIFYKVKVRVYPVDVFNLVSVLREHRKLKGLSPLAIADRLGVPKTLVEHWFRYDKYNAIPLPEYWLPLKEILGIETDIFDNSILTFSIEDSKYDQTNRVYDIEGLCPTITTNSKNVRITDGLGIRNLTVRELWRLMGFRDTEIDKVIDKIPSNHLIKQAGNSIVVSMLESIFKEILRLESI